MKAFWEIFRLEWCAVIRSKALALLTLAVVAWMLAIPRLLHSDGTQAGAFELQVRYSLGIVFALVLVALAASAAGTLAKDRAAKRLQLTLVRPVRHFTVALGRMLALTTVGAFVLALAALILGFQMRGAAPCNHVLEPVLEPASAIADRLFDEYMKEYPDFRAKVEQQGDREVRRYLCQYVNEQYQTVASGETGRWTFDVSSVKPDSDLSVRIRVTDLFGRMDRVAGTFRLGDRAGELSHINKTLITVPLEKVGSDSVSSSAAANELTLVNTGKLGVSICPRRDIHLLVRADAFGWNLFRAWLVLTAVLSLIIAVAVFLGSCLGRSVAVFSILSLVFMMVVSPTALDDCPDPTEMSRIDRLSMKLTEFSAAITSPLNDYSPITALESGVCVERKDVARALALNVVLLPLLFAFLSGFVMVRKQD